VTAGAGGLIVVVVAAAARVDGDGVGGLIVAAVVAAAATAVDAVGEAVAVDAPADAAAVGDGSRIAIGDATSTGVDVGVRCSGAAENPADCSWRVHASTSAAVSPRTSNATLAVADVFNACS